MCGETLPVSLLRAIKKKTNHADNMTITIVEENTIQIWRKGHGKCRVVVSNE